MKIKNKKVLLFSLAILLMVGLLSGCGGNSPTDEVNNSDDDVYYNISGSIKTEDGLAAPKVKIMYEGEETGYTYTNSVGEYNITNLKGETKIKPSKEICDFCSFDPKTITVNKTNSNVNFTIDGDLATFNPDTDPIIILKYVTGEKTSNSLSYSCTVENVGVRGDFYVEVLLSEYQSFGGSGEIIYRGTLYNGGITSNIGQTIGGDLDLDYNWARIIVYSKINGSWVETDRTNYHFN